MPDAESDYVRRPDVQGHLKVMEVLRRWDPLGVISDHNQDEYDIYSAEIVRMLDADATVDDLLAHMRWIVSKRMGVGLIGWFCVRRHSRKFAKELFDYWREWNASNRGRGNPNRATT